MTKIRTNFIEMVLKDNLIGKHIYDNDGNKMIIEDINYQPVLQEVYIKSGTNGFKLSINENYDFELDIKENTRISPNKGKIKNKNK